MSETNPETPADRPDPLEDVIDPEGTALPHSSRRGHAKVPESLDDDDYAAAVEEERVAAGLEDYAPSQVPPATDPLPPEASEEADRAQRGLDQESDEERDNG
ncbi:hypothetical protein NCCP1664_08960 [Zafaria cholistanensis]|uniref:Uncharacterized protein n=1 Tax=Zafaria cholistanensis TaxID=1682741 RepID=A0A5A7NP24_9MICC|nr:hypothetical protein [Zafaria cholistanensis]GER22399.1 hypothetical protein NCCP1664_08960 [Zafaria cholistanensis]